MPALDILSCLLGVSRRLRLGGGKSRDQVAVFNDLSGSGTPSGTIFEGSGGRQAKPSQAKPSQAKPSQF